MQAFFLDSIHDIDADSWDALWHSDYPFTQHAFLAALEDSGSTNKKNKSDDGQTSAHEQHHDDIGAGDSGWYARHLLIKNGETPLLVMPLFEKHHSYGEYVFDWSWANAYAQAGFDYYPKLLNAIPFTPSTGPRVGFNLELSPEDKTTVLEYALSCIEDHLRENQMSGYHSLFPEKSLSKAFNELPACRRIGYQFHWFNQDYKNFDDFLEHFNSRKRKSIKRERKKVSTHGIDIRMREAHEVSDEEWSFFYALYHRTYLKRSGNTGYLGNDFFHRLAHALPHNVLLASAHHEGEFIAAALYLRDNDTLYGRYWGTQQDIDGLHFETCYYQGIEYAIKHKLKRFDPGAQGEHKIQRGFTPIKTSSYHWLSHPDFHRAIDQAMIQEEKAMESYIADARTYLPFKEGIEVPASDILI